MGTYRIPAVQAPVYDADWIHAQLKYPQELARWKAKEHARQEVLREFERQCLAQGAAGLVAFARAAGSLETALQFQWFKNGLQQLKDLQEYNFGTPTQQKEARRKASNHKAGTKRNNRQAAQRLVQKVQHHEQWCLNHGKTAQQAQREAVRYCAQ